MRSLVSFATGDWDTEKKNRGKWSGMKEKNGGCRQRGKDPKKKKDATALTLPPNNYPVLDPKAWRGREKRGSRKS